MTESVVPLFGQTIRGEPSEEVIGCLERLLDKARRGEIIALTYVCLRPNDSCFSGCFHGGAVNLVTIAGAISLMQDDFLRRFRDDPETERTAT